MVHVSLLKNKRDGTPDCPSHLAKKQLTITDFDLGDESSEYYLTRKRKIEQKTDMHFLHISFEKFSEYRPHLERLNFSNIMFSIPYGIEGASGQENLQKFLYQLEQIDRVRLEQRFRVAVSLRIKSTDPLLEKAIYHLQEKPFEFFFLSPDLRRTLENAKKIGDAFNYLAYRGSKTFFPVGPILEDYVWWSTNIRSPYLGPSEMHIDLSNRCNHSCHFCGLYGPEAIEEEKRLHGGNISETTRNFMRQILPSDRGFEILNTIPYSVKKIQFGGAGEPTLHPNFLDYVRIARDRGIALEILSNLSIKDENVLKELHDLGSSYWTDLHIIANVSGATPETYVATRPRQTVSDFHLAINNIKKLCEWRRANNNIGATCTMMMVLTNRNFRESKQYVRLASELGVYRVYLKPLEIHSAVHVLQAPSADEMPEYHKVIEESLQLARKLDILTMWSN